MGNNVVAGIALVDYRLEYLNALARNLSPSQPPDQLFTLATEHGTTNDFNPAQISPHRIHSEYPLMIYDRIISPAGLATMNSRNSSKLVNTSVAHPRSQPLTWSNGSSHIKYTGMPKRWANVSSPCVPAPRPACWSQ